MASRFPSVVQDRSGRPADLRAAVYAGERTVSRPLVRTSVVVDQSIQRRLDTRNHQISRSMDIEVLRDRSRTGSETSSMLVSQGGTSSVSDSTPTLGQYSSIDGSVSVATSRSHAIGPYVLARDEDDFAVRIPTPEAKLPCYFHFLPCDGVFDDLAEWDTHCKSHFRGKLPQCSVCPVQGCVKKFKEADCELTWQARREHIERCHSTSLGGVTLRPPDDLLLSHLRNINVIDLARYKHLELLNPPPQQAGHLQFAGNLRDHRRNRRRKDSALGAE